MIYDNDAPPEEIWHTGRVEFSLRYPFSNGWRTVAGCAVLVILASLVLGALPAVSALVSLASAFLPPEAVVAVLVFSVASVAVPTLAVVGYCYAVCRNTAYGGLRVPELDGLGGFVWKGFFVVVIAGVVAAPVGFVVADAALFLEERASLESMQEQVAVAAVGTVGTLVTVYFVTAFVTVYAVTGSVLRTFLSARALRFAASAHYAEAWLLQFVVAGALLLVGVVSAPTVVGALLWPGYVLIALAAYWGRAYKEALDAGVMEPEDTAV